MVGEIDDTTTPPTYKIFTHKKFELGHNSKQIVDVNLTSDGRVKLEVGAKLSFSYEVSPTIELNFSSSSMIDV